MYIAHAHWLGGVFFILFASILRYVMDCLDRSTTLVRNIETIFFQLCSMRIWPSASIIPALLGMTWHMALSTDRAVNMTAYSNRDLWTGLLFSAGKLFLAGAWTFVFVKDADDNPSADVGKICWFNGIQHVHS